MSGKVSVASLSFVLLLSLLLFCGCEERKETPTKGKLSLYVDESLSPVICAAADSFMHLYPDTKLDLHVVNSREGIVKLLNNETKMFVSARMMNQEESDVSKKNKQDLKTLKFCFDGIACIASFENPLSVLSYDSLKALLAGKLNIKAVIPTINSGVTEYLKDRGLIDDNFNDLKVVKSEKEVISEVIKRNNLIGFIGYCNGGGDSVKILKLGSEKQQGISKIYYEPHPAHFVRELYPLTRKCVIFLSEINLGVGSGFTSFLTANEGQRIVYQHNLGPATVRVKLVE